MTVIKGDWIERQWRTVWGADEYMSASKTDRNDDYSTKVRAFEWLSSTKATSESPVLLQERQFIPDDQVWGEWVTIMKSEGEP